MAGAPFEVPAKYTKATPMGGRVLIKIAETERETKGGVLLTEGSQQKPTSGDVEAIANDVHGVKPGQTVLYNKFGIGADDLILNKEEFTMIRELDLIGTFPRSNASVDDIPDLEPLGDRLILKLQDAEMQTKGGILLTSGSQEKPVQGTVSKVGPGAWDEEKKAVKPMTKKKRFGIISAISCSSCHVLPCSSWMKRSYALSSSSCSTSSVSNNG